MLLLLPAKPVDMESTTSANYLFRKRSVSAKSAVNVSEGADGAQRGWMMTAYSTYLLLLSKQLSISFLPPFIQKLCRS